MASKKRRKQLSKATYDKLKRTAYEYIVEKGMSQKETAVLLDITEATLSKWAVEGKWKDLRQNRQQCISTDADNLKKLLRVMSQQRLQLEEQILEAQRTGDTKEEIRLRKDARALSDEMSKQNKTLLSLDKTSYTLGVFIDIMDEIFNHMRQYDESLWEKTIDFQSAMVKRKTMELG